MSDIFGFSYVKNAEVNESRATEGNKGKAGKGLGWMAAIAAALGKIQGDTAARMLDLVDKLQKNVDQMPSSSDTSPQAGNKRQKLAAEANVLNARLQGEGQMFKIQSETTSTVIKSIGEGNSSVARKQ